MLALALDGAVALVTGGVRGVGLGISQVLRDAGATVVACARRPVEIAGVQTHECDVREPDAVTALVERIRAEHGHLDVLVNNAGGAPYAPAAEASPRFHAKIV